MPNRDVVSRLESTWGTGTDSTRTRFDYTYDWLGRRTYAKLSGTAFKDYTDSSTTGVYNHFTYNDRGEFTSASMQTGATPTTANDLPGLTFKYGYDNIGNRTRSGASGASDGSVRPLRKSGRWLRGQRGPARGAGRGARA